jgi:voltage-dependent calcium channel L type alpha-1F
VPECLLKMSNAVEDVCNNNSYFKNSIIIIIILNTICMASEFYDQPLWLTNTQLFANYVFTGFFCFEMLIKLFGYGFIKYFEDKFNCFDCFVVLMSFLDIGISFSGSENSNLDIIKAFRLLRIFKLIKDWEKFKNIVFTLADSIKPIINLGILMILYLFISALLFKQLCKGKLVDEKGEPSRYGWNNTS